MRLDGFTVKGLFTFKTAVTLAAAQLPRGVIAIVGPNGAGKTGLIEAGFVGALYRKFPTRDRDMTYYTNQREAFIESDYTVEAHHGETRYRSRVNLDGQRNKSAATLNQWDGTRWQPLNDGKTSTFAPEVAARFPSLQILLATAFAASNRKGSFSELDESDRKRLFQELLGLGQFEAWSRACLDVVRAVEKRKAILAPWLRRLQAETTREILTGAEAAASRLAADLEDAADDAIDADTAVTAAAAAAATARAELRALETRIAERANHRQRQTEIDADAQRLDVDLVAIDAEEDRHVETRAAVLTRGREAIDRRVAAIRSDADITAAYIRRVEAIDVQLDADLADRRARIQNNQDLVNRGAEIRGAVAALDQLLKDKFVAAATHAAATTRWRTADDARTAARAAERALLSWPDRLTAARTAAALIDRVPFGAKCADAKCEFVVSAVEAKASIPAAEAGVRQLDTARQVLAARETEARDADRGMATAATAVLTIEKQIADHDRDKTRDRMAQLTAAEDRLGELRSQIGTLSARAETDRNQAAADRDMALALAAEARSGAQTEYAALQAAHAEADTLTRQGFEVRRQAITARRSACLATLAQTRAAVALLDAKAADDAQAETRAATAESQLVAAQARQTAAYTAQVETRHRLDAAIRTRTELQARTAERDRAAAAVAALDAELVEWTFLAMATSRDGLPTLEIDAAGPLVSARANDLLATCYGSQRFTIEIVTQDAKSRGGLKEVFEMKVWDSEDMTRARDISDLSTGEKVLVEEAVKCALALQVNDHSRIKLRTCFRDETTGPLYPDTAMRYMAMLRRVQEQGQFAQLFVVTHNPAVAAACDAQIRIDPGTLTVSLPPYDDVAAGAWVVTPEASAVR